MGTESRKKREKISSEDALDTQPGAVSLLQATRESDRRVLQGLWPNEGVCSGRFEYRSSVS